MDLWIRKALSEEELKAEAANRLEMLNHKECTSLFINL